MIVGKELIPIKLAKNNELLLKLKHCVHIKKHKFGPRYKRL